MWVDILNNVAIRCLLTTKHKHTDGGKYYDRSMMPIIFKHNPTLSWNTCTSKRADKSWRFWNLFTELYLDTDIWEYIGICLSAGSGGTPPRRILKYVCLHNITSSQSHRCMCDIVQVCTILPVHSKGSMNQCKQLINEYTQARDQWLEASRLRTNRKSKDPVFDKVVKNYYEKRHALYKYLRKGELNKKVKRS